MVEKYDVNYERNKKILGGLIAVTTIVGTGLSIYSFYNYSDQLGFYAGLAGGFLGMGALTGTAASVYCCASSFWNSKKDSPTMDEDTEVTNNPIYINV